MKTRAQSDDSPKEHKVGDPQTGGGGRWGTNRIPEVRGRRARRPLTKRRPSRGPESTADTKRLMRVPKESYMRITMGAVGKLIRMQREPKL